MITSNEFDEMDIEIRRDSRTEEFERFIVVSETIDDEVCIDIPKLSFIVNRPDRIAVILIEYLTHPISETEIHGTILLGTEWEADAINNLIHELQRTHLPRLGLGGRTDRERAEFDLYVVDKQLQFDDLQNPRSVPKEGSSLKQLYWQMRKANDSIEDLSESIDTIVDEQYEELQELVESESSVAEKQAIRKQLKVGLERGVPTILYDQEVSDGE